MATSMNPDAPHYEGGLSFVIKSHGRIPGLPGDFSNTPIGLKRGKIDLDHLEKNTGIHVKIFTYTDFGGAVCPVTENIQGICSGSREDMALYESPAKDAYLTNEQRLQAVLSGPDEESPLRIHSPRMRPVLPDYILASYTDEEAEQGQGLPGGIYRCYPEKLIYPLSTPGTQFALSAVIQQVILPYAQLRRSTSVDIHLISCLSTGGIGVESPPEGTEEEIRSFMQAHHHHQELARELGESLPASKWTPQLPSPAAPERKLTRVLPHWMYSAPGGGKRKGKRRKRTRKGRRPRRSTRRRR